MLLSRNLKMTCRFNLYKSLRKILATIAIVMATAFLFAQNTLNGKVVKIVDGDTYDILLSNQTIVRVRMHGIDAPERGMAFYQMSKNYLGELCFGKEVRLEKTDKDRNGRLVGKTFLKDGRELGMEMLKAGMAWHFKRYDKSKAYAVAEAEARRKRVGCGAILTLWHLGTNEAGAGQANEIVLKTMLLNKNALILSYVQFINKI
jgi:micrococcal nuclease